MDAIAQSGEGGCQGLWVVSMKRDDGCQWVRAADRSQMGTVQGGHESLGVGLTRTRVRILKSV